LKRRSPRSKRRPTTTSLLSDFLVFSLSFRPRPALLSSPKPETCGSSLRGDITKLLRITRPTDTFSTHKPIISAFTEKPVNIWTTVRRPSRSDWPHAVANGPDLPDCPIRFVLRDQHSDSGSFCDSKSQRHDRQSSRLVTPRAACIENWSTSENRTEIISCLASMLSRMKAKTEAGTPLLNQTSILLGSNLGNANTHHAHILTIFLPIFLAGGGFQNGKHISCKQESH